jgi:hypothetical protein
LIIAPAETILRAHESRFPLLFLQHFYYSTPFGGLKTGFSKQGQTKTRPKAGFFIPGKRLTAAAGPHSRRQPGSRQQPMTGAIQ